MAEKLEENYISLAQLIAKNQDAEYNKRKIEFKEKVAKTSINNCTKVLQQFLDYFGDGHLFAFESPKYSEKEIEKFKRQIKNGITGTQGILRTLEYEKNTVGKIWIRWHYRTLDRWCFRVCHHKK